jgi:serine/threonine protein kinase
LLNIEKGGPESKFLNEENHSKEHYLLFVDLLDKMLEYEPSKRIRPIDALHHPFFTQFLDSEIPKFPTVSIVTRPSQIEPMQTQIAMERDYTLQSVELSEPFENPHTWSLFPKLVHACSRVASKGTNTCSSTKETPKQKMIRKIFSMSQAPEENNMKPSHNSTKSGSENEGHGQSAGRYE